MIKTLIIDDEPLARSVISQYLRDEEEFEVIGECGNGFEGLKAIQEHNPDLLFLDVQMPKLTGFELLELLDEVPVVIFSTAYDQYALKAFEQNAVDYLLKPFTRERFRGALKRAAEKLQAAGGENEEYIRQVITSARQSEKVIDRIAVRNGSRIEIIPLHKISYIEAQDDYVAIYTEGKKFLKQLTMKYLESALPSHDFIRVHRSYIVAVKSINRLEAYSKDGHLAILASGEKIPVSRKGYQQLREKLRF